MSSLRSQVRAAWAMCLKDLRVARARVAFTVIGVVIPVNFLFLFILVAVGGGQAPTAVVMEDQGVLAQRFASAMENAHSFEIRYSSAADARRLMDEGRIVAIVTIPASFDNDLREGRPIDLPVEINNLNFDFTADIRRAVPLAITSFYADAFPTEVTVRANEIDVQAHDTDYVPYLAVSAVVAAFLLQAIIQAAAASATEYEDHTDLELALSPASPWAITLGKVAAALVLTALAGAIVIALVIAIGVQPLHPLELAGFGLAIMIPFVAIGLLVGSVLKRRTAAIPLAIGSTLPLLFVSGPFAPPVYPADTPAFVIGQILADVSPLTYGVALMQLAFHGFNTWTVDPLGDIAVLLVFAVVAVGGAAFVLGRRARP